MTAPPRARSGAPGGDDNAHIYLGCRTKADSANWKFKNFTTGLERGSSFTRKIVQPRAI